MNADRERLRDRAQRLLSKPLPPAEPDPHHYKSLLSATLKGRVVVLEGVAYCVECYKQGGRGQQSLCVRAGDGWSCRLQHFYAPT